MRGRIEASNEFTPEERELQRECSEFLKSKRFKRVHALLKTRGGELLAGATASEQCVFEQGGYAKWEAIELQAIYWRNRPQERDDAE